MALYASEKYKGVNSASLRQYWPPIRIILLGTKLIKRFDSNSAHFSLSINFDVQQIVPKSLCNRRRL